MRKTLLILCFCPFLLSVSSRKKSDTSNNNDDPSPTQEYNMGVDAQDNKNYPEAIQHYKNAINQQRNFPEAWNNLAFSYRMVAKSYLDQSNDAYNVALQFRPNFADALEYQGELFITLGQLRRALDNYQRLRQMNSPNAEILKKKLDAVLAEAQSVLQKYTP